MEGTLEFEFIGDFVHEGFAFFKITILGQLCNPPDLGPVHTNL